MSLTSATSLTSSTSLTSPPPCSVFDIPSSTSFPSSTSRPLCSWLRYVLDVLCVLDFASSTSSTSSRSTTSSTDILSSASFTSRPSCVYSKSLLSAPLRYVCSFLSLLRPVDPFFHARTHTDKWCQTNCSPNTKTNRPRLDKVNSSACEILFAWFSGFKAFFRHMGRLTGHFFVSEILLQRNDWHCNQTSRTETDWKQQHRTSWRYVRARRFTVQPCHVTCYSSLFLPCRLGSRRRSWRWTYDWVRLQPARWRPQSLSLWVPWGPASSPIPRAQPHGWSQRWLCFDSLRSPGCFSFCRSACCHWVYGWTEGCIPWLADIAQCAFKCGRQGPSHQTNKIIFELVALGSPFSGREGLSHQTNKSFS